MSASIERLIRLYNRLRRGPVTIEIMSKWAQGAGINISERQLYRDLNKLKHLQIAEGENIIEYTDEKNRKTWKLEYDEPGEKITDFDINTFFLLKSFAPYTILEHRKSSLEKFEKIIYKSLSKNKYERSIVAGELNLRRTNYFDQMYGDVEHQHIEDLVWALHNKRMIIIESITINPANIHLPENVFPLKMYPLELVFHRGRVYIAGVAASNNQLLIFAIDSHLNYSLSNESFNRKKVEGPYQAKFEKLFGISDPIDDKTYKIEIEFTKEFALSWMNRYWHSSQKWVLLKNGNYMLHLNCSIGRELIGFIVYGLDKIKVHKPKILKDLLIKKMQQTVNIHTMDLEINEEEANRDY